MKLKSRKLIYSFLVLSVSFFALNSCGNKKDCVEALMDEGYTYEDAVDECEEARTQSNTRPD